MTNYFYSPITKETKIYLRAHGTKMTNAYLATSLLLSSLAWNVFRPAASVAPVALASRGDDCPTLHVFLDGREGKENFLWKCGEPLQVLLTIKSAGSSSGDPTSSPWTNLLCRNDGREVNFISINRTTRYLDLEEQCPGNEKKTFTCSLSVSRRCNLTKYFAVYFVHLPDAIVEIIDYETLVASIAVPAFHLQNLFFPHLEWKAEDKTERLCSFDDRRRRWSSSTASSFPPGSTVFTAILTDRSVVDDDDGPLEAFSSSASSSGCDLRIDNPFSSITYRVKLLSQHPLTRGDELHSQWTTVQLLDLVVPNNVSSINLTNVTSRSLSLEWVVDEALVAWRVPVHYLVQAISHCGPFKEITNQNHLKVDGTLTPGQVLVNKLSSQNH